MVPEIKELEFDEIEEGAVITVSRWEPRRISDMSGYTHTHNDTSWVGDGLTVLSKQYPFVRVIHLRDLLRGVMASTLDVRRCHLMAFNADMYEEHLAEKEAARITTLEAEVVKLTELRKQDAYQAEDLAKDHDRRRLVILSLNAVLKWVQGYEDNIPGMPFKKPAHSNGQYWWRSPLSKLTARANAGEVFK